MALNTAKVSITTSWTQTKANTGFNATRQDGPYISTVSPTVSAAACNRVYFVQGTLAAAATVTIDLRSLTDPATGEALTPARAYSVHMRGTTTTSRYDPVSGTNPLTWFFGAATERINLNAGDSWAYASATAVTVDATNRNVRISNTAGSGTLTYVLVFLLGV